MRKRQDKRKRMLAASAASILMSISLFAGSTFAWFQDSVGSVNTIEIGTYNTQATATQSLAKSATRLSSSATILAPGTYTITVRGVGNTPGYAMIYLSATQSGFRRDTYYTPQMEPGATFTYTFMLHEETAVRVVSIWGTTSGLNALRNEQIIFYGRPPNIVVETTEDETQTNGETQTENSGDGTTGVDSEKKADTATSTETEKKADTATSTETEKKADTATSTETEKRTDTAASTETDNKTDTTANTDSGNSGTASAGSTSDAINTTPKTETVQPADDTQSSGGQETETGGEAAAQATGEEET